MNQGGLENGKWIIIAVVVIILIAAVSDGGDDKDKNPQKVGETTTGTATVKEETDTKDTSDDKTAQEEEVNNVFQVGDVVETENFKITFVSAGVYESDNEFLQPKDGFMSTGSLNLNLKIFLIQIRQYLL